MKYTYGGKRIRCFDPDTMKLKVMTAECMACRVFAHMIDMAHEIAHETPTLVLETEDHDNDERNKRLGNR